MNYCHFKGSLPPHFPVRTYRSRMTLLSMSMTTRVCLEISFCFFVFFLLLSVILAFFLEMLKMIEVFLSSLKNL